MNDLNPVVDLTDPAVLKAQCEEMAGGLEQQAFAANGRNAMQGHPNPVFFFNRAASVLRAASEYVGKTTPAVAPDKPEEPKTDPKKK